ncbi:MAG: exosome complex RNA-binding protein Csl4 [Thermofilaceae archaeon]
MVNKEFVVPGDELGVLEEYLPTLNSYTHEWIVRAKVAGYVHVNVFKHEVQVRRVKDPSVLEENDVIQAMVVGLRDMVAFLDIFYNESKERLHIPPYRGSLHISEVGLKIRNIYELLGYGDIVRARVISGKPPFSLSVRGAHYGLIFARCPKCLTSLKKRGLWLYCTNCRKIFKRKKVSKGYVVR